MRRTEKDRILTVISEAGIELPTAAIARLAGILHPSTRRCLNELRADGYAQRGQTRGTWIYTSSAEFDEPVEVSDTDTVQWRDEPLSQMGWTPHD